LCNFTLNKNKKMNSEEQASSDGAIGRRPLRLLPGIIIVIIQWLIRLGLPAVLPGDMPVMIAVFTGVLGGLAVVIWWAFFSRAARIERWGAIVLIIIALVGASRFLDASIATANMGMMFTFFSIPVMSLAFVLWATVTRNLTDKVRRLTMVVIILVASGGWTLLRTEGMSSRLHFDFAWRWSRTYEEKFLTRAGSEEMSLPAEEKNGPAWPGFRGPDRDGIVHGVRISTDWKATPPVELWRRPVGPGCSSFAVSGDRLFTQEQRGDKEAVTCYNLNTGKPVWVHTDNARFWDSHAGAGPRATPTLCNGRVYTFGATGILDVLNENDGSLVWSRNSAADTQTTDSGWGFTGSPLIVGDLVIIAATGKMAAYDIATGVPRWSGPDGGKGYSSPQLLTINGVAQIVLMSDFGAISLAPGDGSVLWKYQWQLDGRILQPSFTAGGDILVSGGLQNGIRSISVTHESNGWNVKDRWSSTGIKAYFNDIIIQKDHIYGFDGLSLACISAADGKRSWRGGRYGGQMILLSGQDLLLVLTEKGEVALINATPEKFTELGRFPAITGKTWNHPVLVGYILVVRNAREMAAFRLPPA
jgi:outer membrane protein assembly factor BamB